MSGGLGIYHSKRGRTQPEMAKQQEMNETFGDAKGELNTIHNEYLAMVDNPEVVDPQAAALSIVRRILSAGSMEELESMVTTGTVAAEDLVGVPLFIMEDQWYKAAPKYQQNSAGVFVVLTCKRGDTGETVVVTNGGENVLAIVYRMHQLQGIPTEKAWTFRTAETAQGFTTYWLVPHVA